MDERDGDMDTDERDGCPGSSMPPKRLTAHVAPVPGRSMSPDTTRVERVSGPGRRVDEDSYLCGNAGSRNETRSWGETQSWDETRTWDDQRRECDDYRGPPFVDRRPSFKSENINQEKNINQGSFKTENLSQGSFRSRIFTADPDPLDIFDPVPRPPSPSAPSYGYRDGPLRVSAGELNHVDAGRHRHRYVEPENKNFSRETYPQSGTMSVSRETYPQSGTMSGRVDELNPKVAVYEMNKNLNPKNPNPKNPNPKVAVYEMNKIPRKAKDERVQESDEERLLRLRSEHAKIEVRTEQLKLLIDRTVEKENDLRRMNKGRPLADNKEFCDNKKLQMDARKKYEDALRSKREMEVTLDAILNTRKQTERKQTALSDPGDISQDSGSMPVRSSRRVLMVSTDFLDDRREDREEEIDGVSKVEFFDAGDHWCELCQDVFVDDVRTFLDHLHTDDHWRVSRVSISW